MTSETQTETLLVPVANPETAARLLDTAIDIAHGQSMRIVVSHVVEVPPQVPLSEGTSLSQLPHRTSLSLPTSLVEGGACP